MGVAIFRWGHDSLGGISFGFHSPWFNHGNLMECHLSTNLSTRKWGLILRGLLRDNVGLHTEIRPADFLGGGGIGWVRLDSHDGAYGAFSQRYKSHSGCNWVLLEVSLSLSCNFWTLDVVTFPWWCFLIAETTPKNSWTMNYVVQSQAVFLNVF